MVEMVLRVVTGKEVGRWWKQEEGPSLGLLYSKNC